MMKFILIVAVSILSTIASGLTLQDLTRRERVYHPGIAITVQEDFPNIPFGPTRTPRVSIRNGAHRIESLLGFTIPACRARQKCTISFINPLAASGSRTLQLFSCRYPSYGDTWNTKPHPGAHLGNILVPPIVTGPATVGGEVGLTFPCPMTTTEFGFCLAPVGSDDLVIWDIITGGLIITCG